MLYMEYAMHLHITMQLCKDGIVVISACRGKIIYREKFEDYNIGLYFVNLGVWQAHPMIFFAAMLSDGILRLAEMELLAILVNWCIISLFPPEKHFPDIR